MTPDEVVETVRKIARRHGWAIGTHGSLVRDIDLIAVPWTENASATWPLFEEIRDTIGTDHAGARGDLNKPHGREALMIIPKGAVSYKGKNDMDDWNPPAIDISFVDPRYYLQRSKAGAILDAIRQTEVGSDVIIHNEDMSIAYMLTMKCREHPERKEEDGGQVVPPTEINGS